MGLQSDYSASHLIVICPGSNDTARSNASTSQQHDPFLMLSTPPPAKRTGSDVNSGALPDIALVGSFLNPDVPISVPAKVTPNKQPIFPGLSSRTRVTPVNTPMAASSSRSEMLNRTYRKAAPPECQSYKHLTCKSLGV